MPALANGTRHMEESLHRTVREALNVMQNRIMTTSRYFGIKTLKSPLDFWVYQEILWDTAPDFIVEIGNYCGGSALALAHLCDALGRGTILACDVNHEHVPALVRNHRRINFIEGDACQAFDRIVKQTGRDSKVLVIEDSSHTYDNTLAVLRTYAPLIKPGQYFIVEDGICHHGLEVGPKPGPYEAIDTFLAENNKFEADRSKEGFLLTWNPKGYLRRKS